MADEANARSKKHGLAPKEALTHDTFENIVKAVVKPVDKAP